MPTDNRQPTQFPKKNSRSRNYWESKPDLDTEMRYRTRETQEVGARGGKSEGDQVTNTASASSGKKSCGLNCKNKTMHILHEGPPDGVIINLSASLQRFIQHNNQVGIIGRLSSRGNP